MLNLMLDSGAFTAWKSGRPISLDLYCSFLERNPWVTQYIALDHIEPGDPAKSAKLSMQNYTEMRNRGLKPIPVLHIGEDLDILDYYLDAGADYICLAGLGNPGYRHQWYAMCWNKLLNKEGRPVVKVHALGEARKPVLLQFPYASSDSSTWQLSGQLDARMAVGGKTVYMRKNRNASGGVQDIDELEGLNKDSYAAIMRQYGISPVELASKRDNMDSYHVRTFMSAIRFLDIERQVREAGTRYHKSPYSLFVDAAPRLLTRPAIDPGLYHLFFVVSDNQTAKAVIPFLGIKNVLTSFADILSKNGVNERKEAGLRRFIEDPVAAAHEDARTNTAYNILKEMTRHAKQQS